MNLHEVAAEILEVPVSEINDETSPKNTKNWDSLKHINLVLAIEANFGVKFATSEIMLINSLASAKALLGEKGVAA